ncbi:transposase [Candidatus Peregrinibacteria bacterium]|nr:transposase [Candidatus Peregrinibacteria bacterium]
MILGLIDVVLCVLRWREFEPCKGQNSQTHPTARSIPSDKVLDVLEWLFATRGIPHHLRSDNGPEFIAHRVQSWLAQQQCHTLYIEPGHPWENPYIERFIGTLGHDCLNRYCFDNLREVQYIIEDWQEQYNHHRPHSSLNYLTPVEFATQYWTGVIPLTPTGT